MIDLHAHILYGLDDGARRLEDSVEMARLAASAGTTDIVATPHANSRYRFDPLLNETRRQELQRAAGGELRIHLGCDFHLSYENICDAIENPSKYSIGGFGYLLVEPAEVIVGDATERMLAELQQAGLAPIVTHPERNTRLVGDVGRLTRWVEQGFFLQITAQSLTGKFGRTAQSCCASLLDRGLVHFVASDCHDRERRPPRLDLARDYLHQTYGEDYAQLLLESNPGIVIRGGRLDSGAMAAPVSRKRKFQFWRS